MTTNNTPGLYLDSGEFIPASELTVKDALAAGQATAAQAVVPPNAITASVMRDDGGEAPAFCLMAAYRSEKDAMDAFALIAAAPAQPAAQQGAAYAALPEKYYLAGGEVPTWDADQMRAFADATCALRASHGQAPAGAALPESWVPLTITHEGQYPEEVAYGPQIMMDRLGRWLGKYFAQAAQADSVQEDAAELDFLKSDLLSCVQTVVGNGGAHHIIEDTYERYEAWLAARADSVQEDAARLDFLIDQRAYVVSDPDACPGHWLHWARPDGSTWVQGDEHPTPRAAIDAARKQGANHD